MRPASLSVSRFAARSSINTPRLKIAIVANAGNTNLGDEAVLDSTLAAPARSPREIPTSASTH